MKQVYTYSKKQFESYIHYLYKERYCNYINDKLFTQQQSFEDDELIDFRKINHWDDNVFVHISENLPVNEFEYNLFGYKTANTEGENTKVVKL